MIRNWRTGKEFLWYCKIFVVLVHGCCEESKFSFGGTKIMWEVKAMLGVADILSDIHSLGDYVLRPAIFVLTVVLEVLKCALLWIMLSRTTNLWPCWFNKPNQIFRSFQEILILKKLNKLSLNLFFKLQLFIFLNLCNPRMSFFLFLKKNSLGWC